MPDRHALLSASAAHRWLVCTPCARLEEHFPDTSSPYAEEGTRAHSMCETKLTRFLAGNKEPLGILDGEQEMDEYTDQYVEFVEEELAAAKAVTPDARLFVEQELNFADYVPEGFGTSDAVIVSDDTLEVIDFKYGKGVAVDAKENPQLRLYALGAFLALNVIYDFTKVKTVVFQPRTYNVSSEELTVVELLDWAENYVKPRAKMAHEGKGDFVVGEHCRFCKAGATCRARVEKAFEIVDREKTAPNLISDDEIPGILDKLDETEKWIEAIRVYAQNRAITEGVKWRGYKLVESRKNRKVTNEVEAVNRLKSQGYNLEDVTNTKLKGITDLERLLTKARFNAVLGDLVVKPKGEPVLAKENDKRPEINPVAEAFKEE